MSPSIGSGHVHVPKYRFKLVDDEQKKQSVGLLARERQRHTRFSADQLGRAGEEDWDHVFAALQ